MFFHYDFIISHAFHYLLLSIPSSPGGIPARNARGERLLLFLGIIDILQSYRLKKKLEHTWKSMIHDGVNNQNSSTFEINNESFFFFFTFNYIFQCIVFHLVLFYF